MFKLRWGELGLNRNTDQKASRKGDLCPKHIPEMARQPSRAGAQETHRNSAPELGEGTLHFAEAKDSEVFLTSVRVRCPPLERQAMGWELESEP